MLKVMGALCIILGCAGVGICLREKIYDTLAHMQCMIHILTNISNEVLYHKNTLENAVRVAALNADEPFDELLFNVTERYQDNSGVSFANAWKEALSQYKNELYLTEDTFEQLSVLFETPRNNPQLQYERIRETIEKTQAELNRLEAASSNQGRMYVCLGLLTGMISTIILI